MRSVEAALQLEWLAEAVLDMVEAPDPCPRILLGLGGIPRVMPVIYAKPWRGIMKRFAVPDCDQYEGLTELSPMTLANAGDAMFFEPAMVIGDGTGHEWICGEVE